MSSRDAGRPTKHEPDPAEPADTSEIRDGIEFYTTRFPDGREYEGEQCARCGSSAQFVNCWECHGAGTLPVSDWEGIDYGETDECDVCEGRGGSWHCVSPPEWCEAHPLASREHIQSTAMRSEAWNDSF